MKLALICTEKLPSPAVKGGAIQIMIDGIAPFLAKGNELTIFSVTDEMLPDREVNNNIRYIRFPAETYPDDIAEELSRHHFDVIHVFNRPKHLIKYKEAAPDSRFVLSLHNDMFNPGKISDQLGEKAIRSAERLMTVSQYIKDTIDGRFPDAAGKTQVIYSGVDLDRYSSTGTSEGEAIRHRLRQMYGIENKKVILFVGRLSRAKGPHLLIKAMKYIIKDHPDAVLVIAGGKWFSDNGMNQYVRYLHRLAEPLADHVLFTGYVPSEQIPDIYLMADVFVCSSQWQEPLARVHYEAMAAGIPIITTNRGGNPEVIKHGYNGLIINNFNRVSAFVHTISYVLSNSYTASILALNGRKFVEKNHQFQHVAARLLRVYREVHQDGSNRAEKMVRLESIEEPVFQTRFIKI
ncbi:glycosyltransferase family 1 protein [Sporolactobacillus sp. THM7-4]|nr:glycosyltransferase family 1 protein [Sporolactobacillus sp. THM7-4]